MSDERIEHRITELVAEEHALERAHAADGLDASDRERLRGIEVELDRAWDLLRQRRARREAGLDPDDAAERTARVVENYRQ